jgi:hypothetical protein
MCCSSWSLSSSEISMVGAHEGQAWSFRQLQHVDATIQPLKSQDEDKHYYWFTEYSVLNEEWRQTKQLHVQYCTTAGLHTEWRRNNFMCTHWIKNRARAECRTKGEESRSKRYHQTSNSSLRRVRVAQVIGGSRRQGRWLRVRRAGAATEGEESRSDGWQ